MPYAVEVTDPHPTLGGKVIRKGFVWRKDAEVYATVEKESAQELGFVGVTAKVIRY